MLADKSDCELLDERDELARDSRATVDALRRLLDRQLSDLTKDVVQDVAERLIADYWARDRRRGVPDLARCEHALAVQAALQSASTVPARERREAELLEVLRLQSEFEDLAKEIGFTPSLHSSDLPKFCDAARRGERMAKEHEPWDPAIAVSEEYRGVWIDPRMSTLDTGQELEGSVERLLFARAGLSADPTDDLVRLRLDELEDESLASRRAEPDGFRGLSLRDLLLWTAPTAEDVDAPAALGQSGLPLEQRATRTRRQIDRQLIEMTRTPLRILRGMHDDGRPVSVEHGGPVHEDRSLALPTEEEQLELLRDLRRLVSRQGKRARDAAARLNDEWKERVAKYVDDVTGGDPTSERPGADYRGIHHGLVLALRHRLEPFKATYEYGQPDELRKLRGIDNALECGILVLLAEDADFDETAWGFESLGPWNSAHVFRTAREWAALGWPGLVSNRALIRLFAVSTMYTHLRTWVPRFAVFWAMAKHARATLAAADPCMSLLGHIDTNATVQAASIGAPDGPITTTVGGTVAEPLEPGHTEGVLGPPAGPRRRYTKDQRAAAAGIMARNPGLTWRDYVRLTGVKRSTLSSWNEALLPKEAGASERFAKNRGAECNDDLPEDVSGVASPEFEDDES